MNLSEEGWERALMIALAEREIPAQRQVRYELTYGSHRIGRFAVDVMVDNKILLEPKAVEEILPIHQAQLLTYLRVTGLQLGIVVTFGVPKVIFQRMANQLPKKAQSPATPDAYLENLLYPELARELYKVFYTVQQTLGTGFMHMHYRRAVQIELRAHGISYRPQKKITISYQGQPIETRDTYLLLVEGKVLLACVAVSAITAQMQLRMRQYLKLLGLKLGTIVNFHPQLLDIEWVRLPDAK
ncbi:MAG: GxxExxY protein [Caldilineaceae bacterium]|nr:GxxExxY protein [Caldilineaceae bacterium]